MKSKFRYDCNHPSESEVSLLELDFCKLTGSEYAVAMNSCSSALFTALIAAGVKPGDKVAIPAFTFIAVPSAVVHANAIPILVEITDDYVIDLSDLENVLINNDVKVLLLSYMRGRVPNIDHVLAVCDKYDVILIEDAAHALGVLWHGKQVGTFGQSGCFSMQSSKLLDGGEGGMLITNDIDVAAKSILMSGCFEHNWLKHFIRRDLKNKLIKMTNNIPAFNFRMSNVTASLIRPQIGSIADKIRSVEKSASIISNILSENKNISLPNYAIGCSPVPDSIQFRVNNSDICLNTVLKNVLSHNVKIERFSNINARCFWNWGFFENNRTCEKSKNIISTSFDIKLKYFMSDEDAENIANIISNNIGDK